MEVRRCLALLLAAGLLFHTGCGGNPPADPVADGAENADTAATTDGAPDKAPLPEPPPAPAGQIDPAYITADFVGAVVVRPRRAIQSKFVQSLMSISDEVKESGPLAELEAMAAGEGSPSGMVEIVALAAPGGDEFPVESAFILRFADAKSSVEMMDKVKTESEPRQHGGRTYYFRQSEKQSQSSFVPNEFAEAQANGMKQAFPEANISIKKDVEPGQAEVTIEIERPIPPGMPNAAYLPNDTTMIMAVEPMLKKMMDARDVKSPLLERLAALGTDHDLAGVVFMEKLRPAIAEAKKALPPLPAMFAPLLSLDEPIVTATITAGLDDSPLVQLKLETADDERAKQFHQQVNGLLTLGKGAYDTFTQQPADDHPTAKPVFDYGAKFLASITVEQDGKNVVVTAPEIPDSEQLPKTLETVLAAEMAQAKRMNRLRMISIGILNHFDAQGHLPANGQSEDGKPLLSWRVALLPYIEEEELFQRFNPLEPWESEANQQAAMETPEVFRSMSEGVKPGHTTYLAFQGPGTLHDGKPKTLNDVKDGISNTIGVIEVSPEKAVPWSKPADIDFTAPDLKTALGPPPTKEGYPVGMLDGSVQILPEDTDMDTFKKLVGLNDGEPTVLGDPRE